MENKKRIRILYIALIFDFLGFLSIIVGAIFNSVAIAAIGGIGFIMLAILTFLYYIMTL